MKRILLFLIMSVLSYTLSAQNVGPSKTCPTCGKSPAKCQYRGKHPSRNTSQQQSSTKPVSTPPKRKELAKIPSRSQPQVSKPAGYVNGHEYVDLGLSVKWATCNVGANSPEDYGGYYVWGETRTKSSYDWSNYFDCLDSGGKIWDIYKLDGKTVITPTSGRDTARESWGGTWRMPTAVELEELCTKCKWTWTSINGHKGYFIMGPNGNSIFLPAAGWRFGTTSDYVGTDGYYWSSALSSSYSGRAIDLYFYDSYHGTGSSYRSCGHSVRPVTE